MTAEEGVLTARAFADAKIVPIHFEDWAHFSEGCPQITQAYAAAKLEHRFRWPQRGRKFQLDL